MTTNYTKRGSNILVGSDLDSVSSDTLAPGFYTVASGGWGEADHFADPDKSVESHTVPSPMRWDDAAVERAAKSFWEARDEEFRRLNRWCTTPDDPWGQPVGSGDHEAQEITRVAMRAALNAAAPRESLSVEPFHSEQFPHKPLRP